MMTVGKNSFFTTADVDIISHACGVYQYPQLYYQHLEKYQLLPPPYLESFDVGNGEK